MQKLKASEIPKLRQEILVKQNYRCMLCQIDMRRIKSSNICCDHCHKTGYIRGVLCRNCNGILGKVENLATRAKKDLTHDRWLEHAVEYIKSAAKAPLYNHIHPTFKTEAEKRNLRNKRAKARRALNGKT